MKGTVEMVTTVLPHPGCVQRQVIKDMVKDVYGVAVNNATIAHAVGLHTIKVNEYLEWCRQKRERANSNRRRLRRERSDRAVAGK